MVLIFSLSGRSQSIPEILDTVITEFGIYEPYPVTITPQATPYTIQQGLTNVALPQGVILSNDAKEKLSGQGFVVRTGTYAQIYDLLYEAQKKNTPLFITSDAVLHVFHILFDYTLRMLEVKQFYDTVNLLTDLVLNKTTEYLNQTNSPRIKDVLVRNLAFLSVGKILFYPDFRIPVVADSLAFLELNLINDVPDFKPSPIFGYTEDYSQYIPRGHYTRNDLLKQYFRGMMWYGRMMFRLKADDQDPLNSKGKQETLQTLFLLKAIMESSSGSQAARDLWQKVYYPTVFFVGKTDDLSIDDYLPVVKEVYGKSITSLSLSELADETALSDFITKASTLRNPMINSSWVGDWEKFQIVTKGFRFMGQRFIPDSYMLYKLVHRSVPGRMMPKGLDVLAVMGSERALIILIDYFKQSNYDEYLPALQKLKQEFAGLQPQTWAQNLYWNWLYTLVPLLWVKGTGYPFFMQNDAWLDKDLYTALGSWAELRHDTILYAKQSYTERTSIETADYTKGYVEPNPYLFGRLAALAKFMRQGLTSRDLSLEIFDNKLEDFEVLALALKIIAEKELTNQSLTRDEFKTIITFPAKVEDLTSFPPEIAGEITSDTDDKMAVIADVHTDPNSGTVLEEGVGYPLPIYVVCPIGERLVLTQGGIFSYFEFTHPLSDRLTDESWQTMLTQSPPPQKPGWTSSFRDTTLDETNQRFTHVSKGFEVTGVKDDKNQTSQLPRTTLLQNVPNPANPQTSIWYYLEPGGPFRVTLSIYNILGQQVRRLVNAVQPGDRTYLIIWDGKDTVGKPVASGVYFYALKTEQAFLARKLVVLR